MDRAEKSKQDMEKLISEQIDKALAKQPLATKDEIKRIEDKLDQLLLGK